MISPPAYSLPVIICFDGAHRGAIPCVPMPIVTTGRAPGPFQLVVGTITVPVTKSGLPSWSVD
jgi:hypothetical protein